MSVDSRTEYGVSGMTANFEMLGQDLDQDYSCVWSREWLCYVKKWYIGTGEGLWLKSINQLLYWIHIIEK